MSASYRRRGIPSFNKNAVLQLIIACGVCFVSYHVIRVLYLIAGAEPMAFIEHFQNNLALPSLALYPSRFWTILTYGWIHNGFWVLFSNMIWLYVFGSIVQMLIGYKQIIPMFIYSLIVGGVFYELSQLLPGAYFGVGSFYMGAQAGLVALAVAALTISPNYRFHITETFSVPLAIIAILFFALMVMNANVNVTGNALAALFGGAIMGYSYVKILQAGYKPGEWAYNIINKVNVWADPETRAHQNRHTVRRDFAMKGNRKTAPLGMEDRVDKILDKINVKGYDALSKEEKEILLKAGKEKDQ